MRELNVRLQAEFNSRGTEEVAVEMAVRNHQTGRRSSGRLARLTT